MKQPRIKQKLNLLSLQDFVLNERNIENILKFTSQKPKVVKKSSARPIPKKQIHTSFLLPKFSDTLFWCYYIMKNGLGAYEMVHGDGYKDSFEHKIELVYKIRENKELLKQHKWKRNAIEDELVNHKQITVSAFMCICAIQKFNY